MSAIADMTRQTVTLDGQAYDILIGDGVLASAGRLIVDELALPATAQIFIIADETVAARYLQPLLDSLAQAGVAAVAGQTGEGSPGVAGRRPAPPPAGRRGAGEAGYSEYPGLRRDRPPRRGL